MKKKSPRILLSALVVSLIFSTAFGQITDVNRVEEEIRQNADLLMKARMLVGETSSIKARASLEAAGRLHFESKFLYEKAKKSYNEQNYLLARELLMRSREQMWKAREALLRTIALAKREAMTEENALKAIEVAFKRLERARVLLEERSGAWILPARKLVDESQIQLSRAKDNMREHLYGVALQLARSSEALSLKAIKILKRNLITPEEAAREVQKTDRLIERILELREGDEPLEIERMRREAQELQEKAHENLEDHRFRIAIDLTSKAKHLALQVIKLLSSRTKLENVEQEVGFTDKLLGEAREILRDQGSPESRGKLSRASDLQEKAKEEAERRRFDRAMKLTHKARSLLRDAMSLLEKPLGESDVKTTLHSTDELLDRIEQSLREVEEGHLAREIFERARNHEKRAWEEFERGRLRAALAHTKLARNLAHRAIEKIKDGRI